MQLGYMITQQKDTAGAHFYTRGLASSIGLPGRLTSSHAKLSSSNYNYRKKNYYCQTA